MSKVSYFPIVCLDKKVKNNITAFISISYKWLAPYFRYIRHDFYTSRLLYA